MKSVPKVVRQFEWLTLLIIGIEVVNTCLRFDSVSGFWVRYFGENKGSLITIISQIISILIISAFTYFITRKKSVTAKWILIFFVGINVISNFINPTKFFEYNGSWTEKIWMWITTAIEYYMAYLLFTQDFEKWLAKEKQVKERTFPFGIPKIILVLFIIFAIISFFSKKSQRSYPPSVIRDVALMYLKQTEEFIETYKQEHGAYPESLEGLGIHVFLNDTSYNRGERLQRFHQYQLQPDGKHYILFDVGPDGISGTADDIYPSPDADFVGYIKK
jgi:hypothetical protein